MTRMRRYEILLPTEYNDGREVPRELLDKAVTEVVDRFGAASEEPESVEGHWQHHGNVQRDSLSKIVVDVSDTDGNRQWMRDFKARWRAELEQLDIWLISYEITVE